MLMTETEEKANGFPFPQRHQTVTRDRQTMLFGSSQVNHLILKLPFCVCLLVTFAWKPGVALTGYPEAKQLLWSLFETPYSAVLLFRF